MNASLNAIRSFESAARHLSFARAARELGVQPPAVSRQVADLERQLGVHLFVRSKPRLSLTRAGEELYLAASKGLDEIRRGCERVRLRDAENRIRVITSISLTSCWLLKRLIGFYQQYPEIDLQLSTRDSTHNLDTTDIDVAIVFGKDDFPGVEQHCVFYEHMVPVCHPRMLPEGRRFTPEALVTQPLLHYIEPTHRNDWPRLMAGYGIDVSPPARGVIFNSYIVYLQAAMNGDGIAIGWEHLLQDYFDNGSLCRAADVELRTPRGYFCCLTGQGANNPAALQFRDWICAVGQADQP